VPGPGPGRRPARHLPRLDQRRHRLAQHPLHPVDDPLRPPRRQVKVADNWADLIDGTLDAPISRTELNTAPPVGTATCPLNFPDNLPTVKGLTVTNTATNGTLFMGNNTFSCSNWSTNSNGQSTGGGHWSSVNGKWSVLVCVYGCHQKESIYCFQQ
jgi:hypothetical protein